MRSDAVSLWHRNTYILIIDIDVVDSTLPKEYSVALKGLLSLFIVGTHLSAHFQPEDTFLWLRLCNLLTPLSLVFYFFLSGYGLMTQHRLQALRTPSATPGELWKGWLPRRLWGLVKPFLFFYVLAVSFLFLEYGAEMETLKNLFCGSFSGLWRVGIPYPLGAGWFLWELIILYVLYYISFRYIRAKGWAVWGLVALTLLLILFAWRADFGYYWIRYALSFSVGVAYSLYEQKVYTGVKSHRLLALVLLMLAGGVYVWSVMTFPKNPLGVLLLSHLAYYALPVLFFALSKASGVTDFMMQRMHGAVGRALLRLGGISLEVYLLHLSFVNLYHSAVFSIESPLLYMLAVYASAILGAYLIARYLGRWVRA